MRCQAFGCDVWISPLFAAFIALMLIFDRTGLMSFSLAAIAVHEAGHLIMMKLTGQTPYRIVLKPGAFEIVKRCKRTGYFQDVAVASAGSLSNFLTAAVSYAAYIWLKPAENLLAFCVLNLALGVFSLLPVSGLDGGDLLLIILAQFVSMDRAAFIMRVISFVMAGALILAGAAVWLRFSTNPSLLLCGIYLGFLLLLSGRVQMLQTRRLSR